MPVLTFILGFLLLAVITVDFLFTTIGAQERTILSLRLTRGIFRFLRRVRPVERHPSVHRLSGPLVMSALASLWMIGVSVGWTLIFSAWPGSIEVEETGRHLGWWNLYAHVGHLLSTLGATTTVPATTVWYVTGVFVAFNGMVILTLAVSFTLSTTQTVARGRAFAALAGVVDPDEPGAFALLAPPLSEICSNLKSAPFALFYSSGEPAQRLPGALLRFAETLAQRGLLHRYRPFLIQLPGLDLDPDATDADFVEAMADWCDSYSLTPPRSPSGSATASHHG